MKLQDTKEAIGDAGSDVRTHLTTMRDHTVVRWRALALLLLVVLGGACSAKRDDVSITDLGSFPAASISGAGEQEQSVTASAAATVAAGGAETSVASTAVPSTPPELPPLALTDPVCPPPRPSIQAAPVRVRATPPPPVGAAAAVVIDGASGEILWNRDERVPLQPASVTKILTALVAIERGNLDDVVQVDLEQRLLSRGTTMGLVTGDWFTLRDLLYGLMLLSGNDAAAVIAHHFAGSEQAFATLMNQRLCQMGLTDSVFINPSGLGRGEYNLASAYDLAQVARYAMEYPAFRELAAARTWVARGSRTLWLRNLNELVSWYPGADGVKIGWTPGAGNTIVASATRNGQRVIVALLRTPNRAGESAALLDWAFSAYTWPE